MSRPQVKQDGFSQAKLMQDKIDTLERVTRLLLNSTNNPDLQAGVEGPNDIQQAGSTVNSSTLIMNAIWSVGGVAWVRDASGLLLRVPFAAQQTQHLVPSIASGQFVGVGCDLTSDGKMVSTNRIGTAQASLAAAQTQLNVRPTLAANPGYLPILDFYLTNSGGAYSFVAVWDRRSFARGFKNNGQITAGSYTTSSTTNVAIDIARLQFRIECTGNTIEFKLSALVDNSVSASGMNLSLFRDGAQSDLTWSDTMLAASAFKGAVAVVEDTPPIGSHVYTWMWNVAAGTGGMLATTGPPLSPTNWGIAEDLRPNTSNGTG